ncbi:MAG: MFS transporter [Acetobacteraceae bacterium]
MVVTMTGQKNLCAGNPQKHYIMRALKPLLSCPCVQNPSLARFASPLEMSMARKRGPRQARLSLNETLHPRLSHKKRNNNRLKCSFLLLRTEILFQTKVNGCIIGALLLGWLADRWGRRMVLFVCVILFSVQSVGTAIAPSFSFFVIFRMLGGIAVGARYQWSNLPSCSGRSLFLSSIT